MYGSKNLSPSFLHSFAHTFQLFAQNEMKEQNHGM